MRRAVITGLGVSTPIGTGAECFGKALLAGRSAFSTLRREGRACPDLTFLGAELDETILDIGWPDARAARVPLVAKAAWAVAAEAYGNAGLGAVDSERIGLVLGGSNLAQREGALLHESYRERAAFLRPSHASDYMDTSIAGWCAEALKLRGGTSSIGGASASGAMAVIQAARLVTSGELDACIAIGGLADLSHWECRAFRSAGAMGSDRFADAPSAACRPFDRERDGFIFGESCAALVVESLESAQARGQHVRAAIAGWGVSGDANRQPDPSLDGEKRAILTALRHAHWEPEEVDYVNPHASGSIIGDETEIDAIVGSRLGHARINTTKSVTGHGLSASGAVEIIATVIQLEQRRLHPSLNLVDPIANLPWILETEAAPSMTRALKISLGFGGINTAICIQAHS